MSCHFVGKYSLSVHEENSAIRISAMTPAKEEVRRLLECLPDNASFEDIQYHIYVRQKIERGREDLEAGRTISAEEFEARMSQWLEP
jgi:hypothetical protein